MPEKMIHGFREVRARALPELSATLHEMEHQKTGAKLAWIERDEENKTFGVAFTTLPENDTGVFHILEHSVLNGSDRYPVKEPFVELLKNSLNTFLNAITFPDKTVYPVSSKNPQDFLNLMGVYLDAVFHPLIYSRPEIFEQEGWHYEFDESGAPSYKGVVFNEMKGAMASVDELGAQAVQTALFPDNCYQYNSGGDPISIPDLSYEAFVNTHRRFYSPSNAFIFLDGAMDIDKVLSIIDGEYLSKFERGERIAPPVPQKPVRKNETVEFELSPNEPEDGRTRMIWGKVAGMYDQRERLTALEALSEVLCGNNQAPLCKAVLSKGLAEEVTLSMMGEVLQPWLQLEAKNMKAADVDTVRSILREELERLAKEGLDKEQLTAVLTNMEFKERERDLGHAPMGLVLSISMLNSWQYGGDPAQSLEVGDLYDKLRARVGEGYFESLIKEVLLENPHSCEIVMKPSRTAGEERRAKEQARLTKENTAWTAEEKAKKIARMEEFHRLQKREDTPEDLATLPKLTWEDIPKEPETLPMEETSFHGLPVLLHKTATNGIIYSALYFDADGLSETELSTLALLCQLFGELPTRRHTVEQLQNEKKLLCGQLEFAPTVLPRGKDTVLKLTASFSALEKNVEKASDLVTELLTETVFEDEKAIRDLLRQTKTGLQQMTVMAGNSIAINRVWAQFSPTGVATEAVGGFAMYQWLKAQDESWNWEELKAALSGLCGRLVRKNALTVSVTNSTCACAADLAARLSAALPSGEEKIGGAKLTAWGVKREGIAIPADISFAVLGGELSEEYTHSWQVAAHVVTYSYLWDVIRVQGGAYGTGMKVGDTGLVTCHSYRDPSGALSLEKYRKAPEFLRSFSQSGPDMTAALVGTVASLSPLLSPRLKGSTADAYYWKGVTWETRLARWKMLLNTTPQQLSRIASQLEKTLESGGVCVVAGQKQLDGCGLDVILSL